MPNYNITSKINDYNHKFNYLCVFKLEKLKIYNIENEILFDFIWCDLMAEMIKSNIFKNRIKKYFAESDINHTTTTIFNLYYHIFSKLLVLNSNIKVKVSRFIKSIYSIPYIGIQIRVGNDDLNEIKFADEKDIDIMINLAKNCSKYAIWYITGDSQKYKNKLYKEYKNIILYSRNKTKHYAKYTKDFTVIIEHEILSKSKILIISKSTYGFTALLKSGLLLSKNKKKCYIINNRYIHEAKSYLLNKQW